MKKENLNLFCIHTPFDTKYKELFKRHISHLKEQRNLTINYSREILPGSEINSIIEGYFNEANIILLFLSADAMADEEIYDLQIKKALALQSQTLVIPILLRPYHYSDFFATNKLLALPLNEKFISLWGNQDAAFQHIVQILDKIISNIENKQDEVCNLSLKSLLQNEIAELPKTTIIHLTPPPPSPPNHFLGREADLTTVHKKLHTHNNVVLVNGIGGIGKTALAQAYWKKYKDQYQYAAWFTVSTDIEMAILNSGIENKLNITPYEGQKAKERFKQVWRELANIEERKLLIIDNANDSDDIAKHSFNLPNSKVLLTSRSRIDDYEQYTVNTLSISNAQKLFCKHYPEALKQKVLLKQLLIDIGCHTLTIELLAKNLSKLRHKNYGLKELCHDFKERGLLNPVKSRKIRTQ